MRYFLTLLVVFAVSSPAEAQQVKKVARIGFLSAQSQLRSADRAEAFRQGLRELGYLEGKVALGLQAQLHQVKRADEIVGAFNAMSKEQADALLVAQSPPISSDYKRIVDLTAKHRLPAIYFDSSWPNAGGLMSYGTSITDQHRRVAVYVDKILKGAKSGDLPVEQPKKFDLVINLKAANQIGLTIPPNVLLRADRVIK